MTRDQKKRAKRKRRAELDRRTSDRVARTLEAIGLADQYRELGRHGRHWLASFRLPPPEVTADPSFGAYTAGDRARVAEALSAATVAINGIDLPWIDAYTVVLPLLTRNPDSLIDPRHLPPRAAPDPTIGNHLMEGFERMLLSRLDSALATLTGGATEYDRKLYWYRRESSPGGQVRIVLGARAAERIVADIDGRRRPAYRCGGSRGSEGFRWVEWPPDVVGGPTRAGPVPVYVQQHALDRLRERLPINARQRNSSLAGSLANPVVTRRDGDVVLVQFRLGDELHVGHLVARCIPGATVVTTFLLVTMQGTPEADRLYREARLRRPDVEYAGLDRLPTFFNSDLGEDPELARIFEVCGCGDLLGLRTGDRSEPRPGLAATLRAYLGRPAGGDGGSTT